MFLTPEQTLASAQANLYLSPQNKGKGHGVAVLLVRLDHPALFICVVIFVKIVPPVVALPHPWVQSVFQVCLLQGLCPLFQPWLSGPASRGCDPAACPKLLFMEREKGDFSVRKFEPRALGKGTLHDVPLSTRLKAQSSQMC